jgi:Homing endonuclease associated repeat
MPKQEQILKSIAAVAKQLGRAPSVSEFVARSGTPKYFVFRYFPTWNEAVRAAGLRPSRFFARPDDMELLKGWGETVRKLRAVPSRRAYRLKGTHSPRTLVTRFGCWAAVPQAFRSFAEGKPEWADVLALALVPARKKKESRESERDASCVIQPERVQHRLFSERPTYGEPLDFPTLRHEPVNEQGVVVLFGMLAKDLGYVVESVQAGFPDCEAKRQIAPKRWQRVHIEFEFESRNFRDHGHPSTGCDVIVCWRHNWPDCPAHIEVLELSTRIKSLRGSQD